MDYLDQLPVWALALGIFFLRIVDVSLGTCRTIAVVQGRIGISVVLGFLEVLVWVTTVTHVVHHATSNPLLLLAYASGFAVGNAAGILVEKRIAMGTVILRIVSHAAGNDLAAELRRYVPRVFQFEGRNNEEEMMLLLYVVVRRRHARRLLDVAMEVDPDLLYAVDPMRETNWLFAQPPAAPTGWRAVMKKK